MKNQKYEQANQLSFKVANVRLLEKPVTVGSDTFAPGRDKAYFEFTLLSSYPVINSNDACFAYPLLKKHVATAVYSPIDIEHMIEGSPLYEGENRIVGAVVAASVPNVNDDELINGFLPNEGQPVTCIGVLWGRLSEANQIINDLTQGMDWRISMEVDRDMESDVLLVGDRVIEQDDDDWDGAFGAWVQNKEFDGEQVGLALGGTGLKDNDYANFFGTGIVWHAADDTAAIHDITMAPVATKGNDPREFIGIAVKASTKSKAKSKKRAKAEVAAMPKIQISSEGDLGSTQIQIGDETYDEIEDLSLWAYSWSDGEETFSLHWMRNESDTEGVVKPVNYYFDPSTGSVNQENEEDAEMGMINDVKKMLADSGWKSPEDHASALTAKDEEFKDWTSPDDLDVKVTEAVDTKLAERDTQDKAYSQRESVLTEANLTLSDERKAKLRSFELSEDGNKEFDTWVETLKTGQSEMVSELEKGGIEVNDSVKAEIASLDGTKDPRFQKAVAIASATQGRETPLPSGGGGDTADFDINTAI